MRLVSEVEWDLMYPGICSVEGIFLQPGLGRGDHQRPFGGIAFDIPAAVRTAGPGGYPRPGRPPSASGAGLRLAQMGSRHW